MMWAVPCGPVRMLRSGTVRNFVFGRLMRKKEQLYRKCPLCSVWTISLIGRFDVESRRASLPLIMSFIKSRMAAYAYRSDIGRGSAKAGK